MYLFGGSSGVVENKDLFSLDLNSHKWKIEKQLPMDNNDYHLPKTRDEHTAVLHGASMVIFGGFSYGDRTNELFRYHFGSSQWEKLDSPSQSQPCHRAGASAVSIGNTMYLFGGKDDESTTLNDLWKLDMETLEWTKVVTDQEPPTARSGHRAQIYGQYMLIYGGIFEVCKELNDMHLFDLQSDQWLCVFEELNSPKKAQNGGNLGFHKTPTLKDDRRGTVALK